jgi:hypothetical protein
MQVSQEILETQIDNLFESISKRLRDLNTYLEKMPRIVQEEMDRHHFYERLLAEDQEQQCQKR